MQCKGYDFSKGSISSQPDFLKTYTDILEEKNFRKIILQVCKWCVPMGRITNITQNILTNAAHIANERDRHRLKKPGDPRIKEMKKEIY